MSDVTARLLALLSALQGSACLTGPDLAARLGVTVRTVRRDVERLRGLGYVVESAPGVAGGYRLGAGGAAVPPLVIDADEAVAIAVCLRAAAGDSIAGVGEAAARALARVEQMLPARLRPPVAAVSTSTVRLPSPGAEADGTVLVTVSRACRERDVLAVRYRDASGRDSRRRIEPYRVVSAGRRWYLVARDRGAGDWRTFRLDRITDAAPTGHRFTRSDPPDAAAFVGEAITTAPYRHRVRVEIDAPVADVAARVPPTVAVLESLDAGTTLLVTGGHDLDALALHIGLLGLPFRVREPPALRARLLELAACLEAGAG